MPGRPAWLAISPVVLGVVAFDQLTKWRVREALGPSSDHHEASLPGGLATLRYVENRGVSFGMLADRPVVAAVLVAVVALAFGVFIARRSDWSRASLVAAGLIMGGAFGNGIDRIRFGYVTDFIAIWRWPVFNVADSAITVGAIMLVWIAFTDRPAIESPRTDPTQ